MAEPPPPPARRGFLAASAAAGALALASPHRGGHFAAWEEPGLFRAELRAAFGPLRGAP